MKMRPVLKEIVSYFIYFCCSYILIIVFPAYVTMSRKEQLMRALDKVQFINSKNRRILKDFARTIQDIKTCSHGDFNMGNLVLSGRKVCLLGHDTEIRIPKMQSFGEDVLWRIHQTPH